MLRVKKAIWRYRNYWWVKQQSAHHIHVRLYRFFVMLMVLCILHTLAMVRFEGLTFGDALWLTFTTVTTVGYGDFSAASFSGRLATTIFMYIAGISLMAQLVGEFIDYRLDRKQRMIMGNWRWEKMQNHILIINVPAHDTERYLCRFVEQIRSTPGLENTPIQLLTPAYDQGLPISLRDLGVVHRCVRATESAAELEKANVSKAQSIFVLAEDAYDGHSDSVSLDILCHLQGHLVVEAVRDENKSRFKKLGANSVLRPVRAYPEMLVRALVAPGSELILEDLFTHGGARPERIDVSVEGPWGEVATALIQRDLGLPLGFVDSAGETHVNPRASDQINAKALMIMVDDAQGLDASSVVSALQSIKTDVKASAA